MEEDHCGRNIESVTYEELSQLSREDQKALLRECLINYRQRKEAEQLFTCPICFEECESKDVFKNTCGHEFCISCWRENIREQKETKKKKISSYLSSRATVSPTEKST